MWIFPLGAALVSFAFALFLGQQWLSRRKPHQLAWTAALAMFAIASFAAAIGILDRWSPATFRVFYLFGAILNVPMLAAGTIYLLAPARAGQAFMLLIGLLSVFAAGSVATAHLNLGALAVRGIPHFKDAVPPAVRDLSRYYSYPAFVIVVGGALWSAWKLARRPEEHLRRIARANILIALGTTIVASASAFARYGGGSIFSIGLLAGVVVMFAGFLETRSRPAKAPAPEPGAQPG